jgi:hypothetical protein
MDRLALDIVRRKFGGMIKHETGTTAEHWDGGSFVHEAGAYPAYNLSAYVLGVRTEGNHDGLELIIEPRLGDLRSVAGITLCEFGPVPVSWDRSEGDGLIFHFTVPDAARARVHIPIPEQIGKPTLTLKGETLVRKGNPLGGAEIAGRYIEIILEPGEYSGVVTA